MKIEELESSIDKTASLVVELKSKIDETAMKITPKAVVAFRVTCIKNYPQKFPRLTGQKFDEDRGKNCLIIFSQNIVS